MLQHQGVGQTRGEAAIAARIEAPVALQVDATHRFRCRIDRVDQHAGHLVRLHGGIGGVADHPRQRVLAQWRADVACFAAEGTTQPAVGFIAQDAAGVEAGHLVVDADVVVVRTEIQPGQRRPDHAEAIRLGRLRLQLRVGAVAVVDRQAVVVAVVVRLAGGAATPVVGHARVVATGLGGEHIVHVRRTEAGGRGAADQQAFDRTEFDTEAPRCLAEMLATGAVLVVAACQGGGQRLQQRQLQFNTRRIAVTFATGADAGAGVPELAGSQAWVRAVAVTLAARFDHRGQRGIAPRQCKQATIDRRAEGLQPRSVTAFLVVGQATVLIGCQRPEKTRRIRRVDLHAVAYTQLRTEQVLVDTGQQHRPARTVLVARAAVDRLVVPAAVTELATRTDIERPRVLQETVGVAWQAADFLWREAAVPAFQVARILVVEIVA
ncbi:hypothetical protein D3C73_860120 [compost metagenome]